MWMRKTTKQTNVVQKKRIQLFWWWMWKSFEIECIFHSDLTKVKVKITPSKSNRELDLFFRLSNNNSKENPTLMRAFLAVVYTYVLTIVLQIDDLLRLKSKCTRANNKDRCTCAEQKGSTLHSLHALKFLRATWLQKVNFLDAGKFARQTKPTDRQTHAQ